MRNETDPYNATGFMMPPRTSNQVGKLSCLCLCGAKHYQRFCGGDASDFIFEQFVALRFVAIGS
jgi:hypothetical protein